MADRAQRAIAAVLVALGAGCGGNGATAPDASTECVAPDPVAPDPERAARLQLLRDSIRKTIDDAACPGSGCEMVSFQPVPATPSLASEGARILLIDEAIITVAATRYQSRTLAYLGHDADGTYHPIDVSFAISRDALSIFQAADRFEGPLASEEIDLVAPFGAKFSAAIPNWTGHGMDILPFLEDRIPRGQFVVSEGLLDYSLTDPQICGANDPGTRAAALLRLEEQLGNTQQSLSAVIQQYAINYIHLSWGTTRAQIQQFLASRCGSVPPGDAIDRIQVAYLRLLTALGALSTTVGGQPRPVVVFQAGTGANRELRVDDPEFVTDCTVFPGRVRVFAAAYTGTDIPIEGSTDRKYLTPVAERSYACIDLIVNVGYSGPFDVRSAPLFFPTSSLGLGTLGPEWPAVSSFANPVAMAYFAHVADEHPDETVPQWMDRVTMQGTRPTADPLLYGLFPRPFQQTCASQQHPTTCFGAVLSSSAEELCFPSLGACTKQREYTVAHPEYATVLTDCYAVH
jgi:hypothetical protein